MKIVKKNNVNDIEPTTPLEAVEQLYEFFQCDMWHSHEEEWKTEKAMQKYLKLHFKICINDIKKLERNKK